MREVDVETVLDDCFSRAATNIAVLVREPGAGTARVDEQVNRCQRARAGLRDVRVAPADHKAPDAFQAARVVVQG